MPTETIYSSGKRSASERRTRDNINTIGVDFSNKALKSWTFFNFLQNDIFQYLYRLKLPRKPSQIAKTVDGEAGVLLDINLADTNSSTSITFREYYETSISSALDPATYEIQQVMVYF